MVVLVVMSLSAFFVVFISSTTSYLSSLFLLSFRAMKAVWQAQLLRGSGIKLDSISLLYYSSPFNLLLFVYACHHEVVSPLLKVKV